MGATPACIAAVREASAGRLNDAEATALIRRAEAKRKAFEAAGQIDNLDARVRGAMAADAEQAQLAAAIARKQAALSALRYSQAYDHIMRAIRSGVPADKAVLAFLEGIVRDGDGVRAGIAPTAQAYLARYSERWNLLLLRDPEVARFVQSGDRAFAADVVREMRELREGGQPGRTGNPQAQALAKAYAEISETARTDLNRLGATIGRLDGWSPQSHASDRVVKASFQEWRDFILPRLDRARTFGENATPEDIETVLRDIHRSIITGVDRRALDADPPERIGPANLANSLARSRTLHFADADGWLSYAEKFGRGTIHDAMMGHLQAASKAAAQLQMLGPNPEANLTRLLGQLRNEIALDTAMPPKERQRVLKALDPAGAGRIRSSWAEVSGLTATPQSETWAAIGTWLRAWQTLSKMGGAVLSSMPDLVLRTAALTAQGKPIGAAWAENITELLRGRGRDEAREIAALLNAGLDGARNQILAAGLAEDVRVGVPHRLQTWLFRWQGMTWLQDVMKAGAARMLSRWMGENAGQGFDALPERYRTVMRQQGITPQEWDLIRATAWQGQDGSTYVTPDRVRAIPREQLARLAVEQLEALDAGLAERVARREAATAREAEWVRGRTERFQEAFQRARAQLIRVNASAEAGAARRVEALRERMSVLELRLDELAEFHTALAEGRAWQGSVPDDAGRPASTNATLSAEAPATGEAGARPFAPRRERYLDEGDPATLAARAEGELRQRMDALRRAIGEVNRAAGQAEKERLSGLLTWWNRQEQGLREFTAQMEARAAERAALTEGERQDWGRRVERVLEDRRLDLEIKLRRFYADEQGFAYIETDAAARRISLQGTKPGTPVGELMRSLMQFKGYPIAFTQRVLGRALLGYAPEERALQARNLAALLGGLIVFGYLSLVLKDAARGWGPRDPTKRDTIMAALLQSGGAGLYGDFLFAQANRFGNSALETAAGPLPATFGQIINLAAQTRDLEAKPAQALNLALANTPFASLWYLRPAMDFLILNGLRESLSPGFLARQARTRREDFGQERLIPATLD